MDFHHATNHHRSQWLEELDQAVSSTDELTIWRLMDETPAREPAQTDLARLVTRRAYSAGGKNTFCEIFLMPVLLQGSDIVKNRLIWSSIRKTVRDALAVWFADEGKLTLFDDIAPLDWVSTWRPTVFRTHLDQLVPGFGQQKVRFEMTEIDLPNSAPRLGFVVIGRTTLKEWRDLPGAKVHLDTRLKDIVKYCLQTHTSSQSHHQTMTPIVLTPERMQFAITDGVCLWLSKLHEMIGIEGWTILPSLTARDVVKITLKLKSREVALTQFTLRLYQIGNLGLNDVLTVLQQTAPMFDQPLDLNEKPN